ncbi:MAG: YceD family protein [Verrucomicrobiota bacterium]
MFHNIHLNELPPEGRIFDGEIRTDPFALTGPDAPRFLPPLIFSVCVQIDGPAIVVDGSVSARFDLLCVRCGQWFPFEAGSDHFHSEDPRDGASTLDLTELLREHTLLALPGHPRCEESNVEPRACPAAGRFVPESEFTALPDDETPDSSRPDPWQALTQLQPDQDRGEASQS